MHAIVFYLKYTGNLMLHLLDGFVLEGCDDAFSCIDGPLGLVCGVSEVTESEGWTGSSSLLWHRLYTCGLRASLAFLIRLPLKLVT